MKKETPMPKSEFVEKYLGIKLYPFHKAVIDNLERTDKRNINRR